MENLFPSILPSSTSCVVARFNAAEQKMVRNIAVTVSKKGKEEMKEEASIIMEKN